MKNYGKILALKNKMKKYQENIKYRVLKINMKKLNKKTS